MTVIVSLDIYSGVPNPTWELTGEQATEFKKTLESERESTSLRSPAGAGRLGYRGFQIRSVTDPDLPQSALVFDGVLDIGDSLSENYVDSDSALEKFLLETGIKAVPPDVYGFAEAEIEKNSKGGMASSLSDFQAMAVPPYNPGKWNNDPQIRANNNCYNYGNDKITNTFAQPGRCSGQVGPYPPDCGGTGAAAGRDGLVPVSAASSTPAEGHYAALVIWPGRDYHWYRLDADGMWSHKPGSTPARNTDNSGRVVSAPKACDRGPYTVWCGFYHSKPSQTCIL